MEVLDAQLLAGLAVGCIILSYSSAKWSMYLEPGVAASCY